MQISKSTESFRLSDHIRRKKTEMSQHQDLLNEAYQRALSGGKYALSKSQEGFSNSYLKQTLRNPAIIHQKPKKQEGNI